MQPTLTGQKIEDVIGADLRAAFAGTVNYGPTMEEKMATKFGGAPSDYVHLVACKRFWAPLRYANEAKNVEIDRILAQPWQPPRSRRTMMRAASAVIDEPTELPTKEEIRQRIDTLQEFVDSLDEELEERPEQARFDAECFRGCCQHEARHAAVGIDQGCRITEIYASAHGGHVQFAEIPPRLVITAGSVWDERGMWGETAGSDRDKIEASIAKELDERLPEDATPLQRRDARANLLASDETAANYILEDRWPFYATIRDLLLERRSETTRAWISGEEAHEIWNELYPTD